MQVTGERTSKACHRPKVPRTRINTGIISNFFTIYINLWAGITSKLLKRDGREYHQVSPCRIAKEYKQFTILANFILTRQGQCKQGALTMARVKVRPVTEKQDMHTKRKSHPRDFQPVIYALETPTPLPSSQSLPKLKTPAEQQAEQVTAIMPAYKEAYTENRDRLIAYLTQGFFGNLSDGIVLSELGTAIKSEYAPRNAMSPAQYTSLIADLTTEDYDTVAWIQALRQYIWRTNEHRRPSRPLIDRTTWKI